MLTRAGIALAERGLVPDWMIAVGIDRLLRARLRALRNQRGLSPTNRLVEAMTAAPIAPIALETASANVQHYEVPPAFFQHVLGARLKYSCGWWADGADTLDAAEERMLALTVARARIVDGMRVLDLGCGWGALTLWLAEHFPHCQIVALSNSRLQRESIERVCRARGWTHVDVITADINTFETDRQFDRIVSVEMLEHVRNYPRLFDRLASWLTPFGRLFIHLFCHREFAYPFEDRDDGDWMAREFFSAGLMPSEDLIGRCIRQLRIEQQWRVNGRHYARTANAWLANLDRCADEIIQILAGAYGASEASLRLRRWRLFFLACRETFAFGDGEEWFVSHYLLDRL
jgi:cyclopropane-fatty-acyl-phospholipid synthase